MKDRPIEAEQQREAAALAALGRTLASIAPSRFDLDEVLKAVVEEAAQLCHADSANIAVRDGNAYRQRAFTGFSPEFKELVRGVMYAPDRESVVGRTILDGRVVHPRLAALVGRQGRRDPDQPASDGDRRGLGRGRCRRRPRAQGLQHGDGCVRRSILPRAVGVNRPTQSGSRDHPRRASRAP
jgi:hypothetical protein